MFSLSAELEVTSFESKLNRKKSEKKGEESKLFWREERNWNWLNWECNGYEDVDLNLILS